MDTKQISRLICMTSQGDIIKTSFFEDTIFMTVVKNKIFCGTECIHQYHYKIKNNELEFYENFIGPNEFELGSPSLKLKYSLNDWMEYSEIIGEGYAEYRSEEIESILLGYKNDQEIFNRSDSIADTDFSMSIPYPKK